MKVAKRRDVHNPTGVGGEGTRFKAGNEGKNKAGRPKGAKDKHGRMTGELKEAILLAAEEVGGPQGLVGYLKSLARTDKKSFSNLLGRILPNQITATVNVVERLSFDDRVVALGVLEALIREREVIERRAGSDSAGGGEREKVLVPVSGGGPVIEGEVLEAS